MKTTNNIVKFNNVFQSYYDYLYDNAEAEDTIYLMGLGDNYLKNRFKDLANSLADYRNDPITSDREAAAFALAILHAYHVSPIQIKIHKYQKLTVNIQKQPKELSLIQTELAF